MSHKLKVAIATGSSWKYQTCDDIEERERGIYLYDKSSKDVEKIGYVPYDNLAYVRPNDE